MSLVRTAALVVSLAAMAIAGVAAGTAGARSAANPACGATLTASVTLTANMDCSGYTAGPALNIGAPGITINLNGRLLTGPGGSSGTAGIAANWTCSNCQAFANVTIKNGFIKNFYYDIYINGDRNLTLTSLNLMLDGSKSRIGVYAQYLVGGTFSGLNVSNAVEGIWLYADSNVWITNSVVHASNRGYYDEYGASNTYSNDGAGNNSYGFYEDYGNRLLYSGDGANGNSNAGFYMDGDSYGPVTLKNDTATYNGSYGIYLFENYSYYTPGSPPEVVTGNKVSYNYYYGIYDYFSIGASIVKNTASYNSGYGIYIDYPTNYTIDSNTTNNNTGGYSGIYVADDYGYYQATDASNNTANNNTYYGLYAAYGLPGGSNTALNNTPFDCWNWACGPGSTRPSAPPTAPIHSHSAPPAPAAKP